VQPVPFAEQNGRILGYIVSYHQMGMEESGSQLVYTNVTSASVGLVDLLLRYLM